jgi:Predicted lactoylglutathione lyase
LLPINHPALVSPKPRMRADCEPCAGPTTARPGTTDGRRSASQDLLHHAGRGQPRPVGRLLPRRPGLADRGHRRQEFHDEVTGADGTIAFFTLDGGLLLGLYERTNLAKDASLPAGPPSSTEFSLGVPATSQAEVDQLLAQVEAAGGTVTAPAHMRPFGVYSGYFTDPDGHLFEIAWDSNQ